MLSRIKFEIEDLVNEMLDQLPEEVWTSSTTTFLDPAFGGGQFVRAIEQKLRMHGHSDANISKRVYGCESSKLNVKFVLNKYKLVGKYTTSDFLTQDFKGMKFDVVVGNPPYQSGNGEKGGKHSLWRKIVKKAFSLVSKDRFVGFVCPGFPYLANDLADCFLKNTPRTLVNDASNYFPGVGSEIKYWIVQEGKHNVPFVVDGINWANGLVDDPTVPLTVIAIKKKISGLPVFECKQDRGYSSTQYKNDLSDYFDAPCCRSVYPIRHASTVKVCYVHAPTACHTKNKVMMTFSGYPDFEYFDGKTSPMSSCYQMSGYIEVNDSIEGANLISIYNSKLYKFLSSLDGAGMKSIGNYTLPKLSLNQQWTDVEIYKYFNLTQEEIDYVEANVR